MSRLENLMPVAITGNSFSQNADGSFSVSSQDKATFNLTAFEKQFFDYCRGMYSFKEISLLLYSKIPNFSFTMFYDTIRRFCDEELFRNREQIYS
ncbi:MAG: hypothetical protein IT287_09725, partial [Bdellovibrionaceae bacterium]|nr:hypothetical protein [Pseudobdellovibrionaceae bacterium]